jgi:hypothetical protein
MRRALRAPFAPLAVIGLLAGVALAGCGASSLSASQLRSRAAHICTVSALEAGAIPTPTTPAEGARFVRSGIAVLRPELVKLRTLQGPDEYRRAVAAMAGELAALRFTLKGLRAGNDPVVAIKTLQRQLAPIELRGSRAWSALGIPACASR